MTHQNSSPQGEYDTMSSLKENEDSGLAKSSSATSDSAYGFVLDYPHDKSTISSESTPTSPESGSPHLDQLLSDLEEMKLKFSPEALCQPLLASCDKSFEGDPNFKFEDLGPEDTYTVDSNDTIQMAGLTEPEHVQTSAHTHPESLFITGDLSSASSGHRDCPISPSESPESPQQLCETMEPPNSGIPEIFCLPIITAESPSDKCENEQEDRREEMSSTANMQMQSKEHESATPSNVSKAMTEEMSPIPSQLPHLGEETTVNTTQKEDLPSEPFFDVSTDTVEYKYTEYLGLENLISETPSPKDEPSPNIQYSTDYDCLASQATLVTTKADVALSSTDEEYMIPPNYEDVVESHARSPTFELSDTEAYFDCEQGASDLSETEPDEPESKTRSTRGLPQGHPGLSRVLKKGDRGVLLSSGSEDYEDAVFVHGPPDEHSEESKEEVSQAPQLPPVCGTGASVDTGNSLTREITAEFGSMSESSDDDVLTTRIVQRRVVIKADEMPDLPTQSVTEEKYQDENGHIIVKRVTRKIVRKCVSADGVEHAEVTLEGAAQGSVSMTEGDGYSKVLKRTVVKSEGDNTEVTFAESEGFSASRQDTEGTKVSLVEKTTIMKGERTMTVQGDRSLSSDLPSAQDDFKQALGYVGGSSGTKLPHVVETETVKEDGTVVRRARMRKGRTLRRTEVKRAGQPKVALRENRDNLGKGSKVHDLQQHLHQLFDQYQEEDEEGSDEGEEVEGDDEE